ncbi:MAG: hypothetical protein ACRDJW_11505 [Thermomicrobiales bacterium]
MSTRVAVQTIEEHDSRMQDALAEMRDRISDRFPGTVFTITHGEDPDGIRLTAIVDVDDLADVTDAFVSRLTDLQVDEGLPIYVVLEQPVERVMAQLRERKRSSDRAINRIPELLSALGIPSTEEPLA